MKIIYTILHLPRMADSHPQSLENVDLLQIHYNWETPAAWVCLTW